MPFATDDRVRDVTTTTGTGAVTVSGDAPIGYQTFRQALAVNDTFLGMIAHQTANEWETGLYTYSALNTVTRTTILASSNAGSAVSFSAGVKDVVLTQTAKRWQLATDLTVPKILGGSAANSSLILQSTSGAGSSDNVGFYTGNSGVNAGQINTSQNWLVKASQGLLSDWLSWTPTFAAENGGTFTSTNHVSQYWRCGKFVMVRGEFGSSNIGSAVSDVVTVTPPAGITIAEQSVGPMWDRNTGSRGDAIVHAHTSVNKLRLIMGSIGPFHNDMTLDYCIGFFASSAT